MALDPFAKLGAQFQQKGYDPLAIMAGLGVGRRSAAELQEERQKREEEASRQASEMQLRAKQLEQEAAAQAARQEYEMQQLGMTERQREQEAEMQQKQLDRQIAESQANEAYRQAALAQQAELSGQQLTAQAEQARLTREAAATEALLGRQGQIELEKERRKSEREREVAAEQQKIAQEKRAAALPQKEVIATILNPVETVNELTGVKTSTPPSAAVQLERALLLKDAGYMIPDALIERLQAQVGPAGEPGSAAGGLAGLRARLAKGASAGAPSAPAERAIPRPRTPGPSTLPAAIPKSPQQVRDEEFMRAIRARQETEAFGALPFLSRLGIAMQGPSF